MFQNIHTMHSGDVHCAENLDSVEDFINRHRVKDNISTGTMRDLLKDIYSVKQESFADKEKFIKNKSKPNHQYANDIAPKIFKYLTKLDQLAYRYTEQSRNEKQNRDLKRFINFLRHKHLPDAISSASFQNESWPVDPGLTDTCDYKLLWEQYRDLNDLVRERREKQSQQCTSKVMSLDKQAKKALFESKLICYPSLSSYKRINKLQREMGHTNLGSYLSSGAAVHQGTVLNCPNSYKTEVIRIPSPLKKSQQSSQKSKTKFHNTKPPPTVKQGHSNDLNKKAKENLTNKVEKQNMNYLLDIEGKIDSLVNSINLLITEIQAKQTTIIDKTATTSNVFTMSSNNEIDALKKDVIEKQNDFIVPNGLFNITKPMSSQRTEEKVKFCENKLTGSTLNYASDKATNTKKKAQFAEKSSVGFTVKVPTSEKAVAANEIIAKPQSKAPGPGGHIEEKSTTAQKENASSTTKGANTEPLGILSLLRVSTATVRQLLSLLFTFDYYSYLPIFQNPNCSNGGERRYVCNICRANFEKESLLNDHIKGHYLGFARNCCDCHRVVNSDSVRREELFGCQFCGERFTRAYCRELHQQDCAKRHGLPTEVSSGLILLR